MFSNIKSVFTRDNFKKFVEFLKLLRIEPYLMLIGFQMTLRTTPNSQMVEDKICVHWFNGSDKYCHDLPSNDDQPHVGDVFGHYKSQVLSNAAQFSAYDTYITTVPYFIWAIISGNWIDRYRRARKLLLYMNIFGNILEDLMSLYLSIQWQTSIYYNPLLRLPVSIFGGHTGAMVAIQHYMTSTTPPHLMAIRFMIFELSCPIGSVVGGYILVQNPVIKNGEIRNYSLIYMIALAFEFLALIWVIFMVNERVLSKQTKNLETEQNKIETQNEIEFKEDGDQDQPKDKNPFEMLFNLRGIMETVKAVFKKRPNKGRIQIILLVSNVVFYLMILYGGGTFSTQFDQKVYLWGPDWKAYVSAMSIVFSSVTTACIIPLLSKTFSVSDIRLGLIGFIAHFVTNIIKGSWLNSIAHYISMPIVAIGGAAVIGTKSHATKIVDRNEIGKLMSFMAAVNTLVPIFTNTFMLFIFKSTIDSYPSTIFLVVALITMIPILILMWIDLYTDPLVTDQTVDKSDDNEMKENNNTIDCIESKL